MCLLFCQAAEALLSDISHVTRSILLYSFLRMFAFFSLPIQSLYMYILCVCLTYLIIFL